ncbi:3'-phosphoadenylsulfate reductase [Dimargaris verticillata]|uniref:3'-phosphoadenylsulfate reductase n=1 Tax=Dimargaris verticillata TaxID=2761393 RepID=A0A9W8B3E6_9FUNG|nr:3'-phosphoadenylsulfate reductase [Dimargaris verticillata]
MTPDDTSSTPGEAFLSGEALNVLNQRLALLEPTQILEWACLTFPQVHQSTAFGPSGLVITDLLHNLRVQWALKHGAASSALPESTSLDSITPTDSSTLPQSTTLANPFEVPLIFLDTLYHFEETLALVDQVRQRYQAMIHVYRPAQCETRAAFEAQFGTELWRTEEAMYDYLVKVEPARRAYQKHGVRVVITGRRRSQRGERAQIPIIEVEKGTGLIKLNPLAYWSFDKVWAYLRANEVPYNALLDQGYRSIGDVHSTKPTAGTDDERSGRWEGQAKSECGLHKDYFAMRKAFMEAKERRVKLGL